MTNPLSIRNGVGAAGIIKNAYNQLLMIKPKVWRSRRARQTTQALCVLLLASAGPSTAQILPSGVSPFGLSSGAVGASSNGAQATQPGAAPGGAAAPIPQTAPVASPALPGIPATMAVPSVTAPVAPRDQLVVVSPAPAGRMFGSQLFGGTFRGTVGTGFNPDYVIAVGDRLQLRLWGAFNFDASMIVDPQGNIFIPNVGPVMVAGVKSGELNQVVEQGVRKTFKSNTGVYAALDVSQPVKVYVTGFVRQPGLYSGVAADSAISYLDKAGGIDQDRGSYIDIVIKRGAQIRKRVNLYSFLLDGTLDLVQFQDGDVVLVGPRQHTFSVAGEAFNAYDFEFSEPTVPLQRALDMAKVKPGATHVSIVRRQGIERTTEYYPIKDTAKVTINDGDNVTVTADRYPGTIQVRIEGAHSGEHAMVLPYGATLKDVLARIKTNPMSRMDAIQIYRKSVADRQREMLLVSLQKLEEATLSARSASVEEAGLRAKESDSIMRFVERAKNLQPKGQIVLNELERDSMLLQDGDAIVIPERTSLVMVHGEVLFPNAVSWQSGLAPDGYIKKAGGFTQGADTSRVVVIRQNGATMQVEESDRITAGDEIIVLPKIETKSIEVTRSLTQIIYQIAFSVGVIFGIFNN